MSQSREFSATFGGVRIWAVEAFLRPVGEAQPTTYSR